MDVPDNGGSGSGSSVMDLARARTVLLETQKRDGSWVGTPVSLVQADGRMYFRTYDQAGKAKRMRNFPQVRMSPCTFLGKVRGTPTLGTARLLEGADATRARQLLARRFPVLHGLAVPSVHRIKGWVTLHYEFHAEA